MNKILICEVCDDKDNQVQLLVCGHYICCKCYNELKCVGMCKCPFCFQTLKRRETNRRR